MVISNTIVHLGGDSGSGEGACPGSQNLSANAEGGQYNLVSFRPFASSPPSKKPCFSPLLRYSWGIVFKGKQAKENTLKMYSWRANGPIN